MKPNPTRQYVFNSKCSRFRKFDKCYCKLQYDLTIYLPLSLSLSHSLTYGAKTYVGKDKIPVSVYQQAERNFFKRYLAGIPTCTVNRIACRGKGDDGQIHHRHHSVLCLRYQWQLTEGSRLRIRATHKESIRLLCKEGIDNAVCMVCTEA